MSIEGFLIRKKRPIENVDNRSASTLTPEQKKRMEENRLRALKKRKQNVLDLNALLTSQSWRDALKTTLAGSNFTKIETFLVLFYFIFFKKLKCLEKINFKTSLNKGQRIFSKKSCLSSERTNFFSL